jgi:hypothetical protein
MKTNTRFHFHATRILASILISAAVTGCTSSRFQKAPPSTPPAIPLNIAGPIAPLATNVETVIVYDGPGSWKSRAFWDEYIVSFTNRSGGRIEVERAELLGADGKSVQPGYDWEELERESRNWWARHATTNNFVLGASILVLGTATEASSFLTYIALMSGGTGSALLPYSAGALLVFTGLGSRIDDNENAKQAIGSEFDRRRIGLPKAVAPRETVIGSLFFRITPGPQKLVLQYRDLGGRHKVMIDLYPIAGLHLKEVPSSTLTGSPIAAMVSTSGNP